MTDAHTKTEDGAALTEDERDFARHALGLTNSKVGYRNFYAAGGSDAETGRRLVARGFAVEFPSTSVRPEPTFMITREGFEAVKHRGEAMDREEAVRFDRLTARKSGGDK
jgi:hypothetical protein